MEHVQKQTRTGRKEGLTAKNALSMMNLTMGKRTAMIPASTYPFARESRKSSPCFWTSMKYSGMSASVIIDHPMVPGLTPNPNT
jgi:hypothetical protein